MSYDARVKELNLELPPSSKILGVYKPVLVSGGLVYMAGQGPVRMDGTAVCGRLGENIQKEEGYQAARLAGLKTLGLLRDHFGTLDKIRRIVKTTGFVNATPDFHDHPAIVNGFSELMRDVFGPENGIGARTALGIASLPLGWAVEVDAIFEVAD